MLARPLVLALLLALPSCSRGTADGIPSVAEYRSWGAVTEQPVRVDARPWWLCIAPPVGWETRHREEEPERYLDVYVEPRAREAFLRRGEVELPAGTVIVKEKLSPPGREPQGLGVMIKDGPAAGDDIGWRFAYVDRDGTVFSSADDTASCAACHGRRAHSDYVFRTYLHP